MLRALMDKVGSRQEQMGNVCRETEIPGKNQTEILEIKGTVKEMKAAFGGLVSRLDMDGERPSELKDVAIESSKTGKYREQILKKKEQNI